MVVKSTTYCEIGCAEYFFLLVVSFMIKDIRSIIVFVLTIYELIVFYCKEWDREIDDESIYSIWVFINLQFSEKVSYIDCIEI